MARPRMYDDPDALQAKIDEYFDYGVRKRLVQIGRGKRAELIEMPIPTITGLALYCGFASRQSFYDMQQIERFSYVISRARGRIEQEYEEALTIGVNPAGPMFALKNLGWSDRLELTGKDGGPIKQEQSVKFDWSKVPDSELDATVKDVEKYLSTP